MTPTLYLRDRLATYAQQLIGLGATNTNTKNFFFGPAIVDSEVLEKAIRNVASYPALMLEYADNAVDSNNNTGTVETLSFGLSVIANHSPKEEAANIDELIYGTCKPLLDQVIARLQRDSDKKLLKYECFQLQLLSTFVGSWVGPIANGAYGFNYGIEIRLYGSIVFDENKWIL